MYKRNSILPIYTEDAWNALPDDKKYGELIGLKPKVRVISSIQTPITISSETDNSIILKISKKDCRHLLKVYVTEQGYPHFTGRVDKMLVHPMRNELMKARDLLAKRTPASPQSNKKKYKQMDVPFILTHETTDDEIRGATKTSLLTELKTMYEDRNLTESVDWNTITIHELHDMAVQERDEMKQCFSDDDDVQPSTKHNVITIADDDDDEEIDDDDEDMDGSDDGANENDVDAMDMDHEMTNADKFIQSEIEKEKSLVAHSHLLSVMTLPMRIFFRLLISVLLR